MCIEAYFDNAKSRIFSRWPEQSAIVFPDLGSTIRIKPSKVATKMLFCHQANLTRPVPRAVDTLATCDERSQTEKINNKSFLETNSFSKILKPLELKIFQVFPHITKARLELCRSFFEASIFAKIFFNLIYMKE